MSAFLRAVFLFVLAVVVLSAGPAAQRGGAGAGTERSDAPAVFDSEELKIRFDAPRGVRIYTPDAPGPFKASLIGGKFLRLGFGEIRELAVEAKSSPNVTETDLKGYLGILETTPPQAKLEGFKKVRLKTIKIGKERDKEAIDFVYNAKQDGLSRTFRLVAFVHNGNGFTFTGSSLEHQFGEAELKVYGPLFSHMEFR